LASDRPQSNKEKRDQETCGGCLSTCLSVHLLACLPACLPDCPFRWLACRVVICRHIQLFFSCISTWVDGWIGRHMESSYQCSILFFFLLSSTHDKLLYLQCSNTYREASGINRRDETRARKDPILGHLLSPPEPDQPLRTCTCSSIGPIGKLLVRDVANSFEPGQGHLQGSLLGGVHSTSGQGMLFWNGCHPDNQVQGHASPIVSLSLSVSGPFTMVPCSQTLQRFPRCMHNYRLNPYTSAINKVKVMAPVRLRAVG
jgi:hypothetical protein